MESTKKPKQLTFICPVSSNSTCPLAVFISKNEEMSVLNLKKILIKSLGRPDLKLDSVSLSKIHEKKYDLMFDADIIKGKEAVDKFIYAFEISNLDHKYKCLHCEKNNIDKLKFFIHEGYNCFLIMCSDCMNYFSLCKPFFKCPICDEVTVLSSFKSIGVCTPVLSFLNIPIDLCGVITKDYSNGFSKKLGSFRLFTFEDCEALQKNDVHFIEHVDHKCEEANCYKNKIAPELESKNLNLLIKELTLNEVNGCIKSEANTIPEKQEEELSSNYSQSDQKNNSVLKDEINQNQGGILQNFCEKAEKILEETLKKVQEIKKVPHINRPQQTINPFDCLNFSGRNDLKHPCRFIEDFEFFADRENLDDYEKQLFFGQSLTGGAAIWLKIRGYGPTYDSMKESFLNFYWSEEDQNRFLFLLKRGNYKEDTNLSMFEYFYKYATEAKFLNVIPHEEQLAEWLVGHFDINVQNKLSEMRNFTVNEILHTLKDLESPDINQNLKKTIFNFFSTSVAKKSKAGVCTDCFGNEYEGIKKGNELFYRCRTVKIWAMHSLSYNNAMSEIKHFDTTCDENSSRFLTDIPEKLTCVYVNVNKQVTESFVVLGKVTIAKQNGRQLIVSTCPSFRTSKKLTSGQLIYYVNNGLYRPCGIITCSVPDDAAYRYVLSNNHERVVCLSCIGEKIEEVEFCEGRTIAATDLIVQYFEQKYFKRKRILRFLNQNLCTIYTVWDAAVEKYNPLEPTYH